MKNKIIFLAIFSIVGFVLLQIPVNTLAGSRVKFTLFDLFAPTSGALAGNSFGIISVFVIQVVNLFFHGFDSFDKGALIRLFPTLFAVWYFSKSDKKQLIIPVLAIVSYNLNPVGRSVWYYSLFWLIPLITYPFKNRFLILKAYGSTFTAHAVGGAIWVWTFNMPALVWQSLIPVVILERSIFALGISASYIFGNNVFALLAKIKLLRNVISYDKRYLLPLVK